MKERHRRVRESDVSFVGVAMIDVAAAARLRSNQAEPDDFELPDLAARSFGTPNAKLGIGELGSVPKTLAPKFKICYLNSRKGVCLQKRRKDYTNTAQYLWTDVPAAHQILASRKRFWRRNWRPSGL
jgi:hypothetical protein